jgi:phosphatidylserine decarboxylase
MPESSAACVRAQPEPLPDNLRSTQPGGGICYQIELAWGRWRRWYLRRFRPGYVRRMAQLRRGSGEGCPHEILDPRDLKFCRNQTDAHWDSADDPFAWREQIPFARWGLAELQLMGWPLLLMAVGLGVGLPGPWRLAAAVPGVLLALVMWFFRDPPRHVPQAAGLLVSPADGKVVEITELENHEYVGGPAVKIGIFLTIFNVHVNRAPCPARVLKLHYSPGKFLNAMDPESALVNENLWIGMEETEPPHRRLVVRQISGAVARRIVCGLRPGQEVQRGEKFGMIKLGSRTELIVPADGLELAVRLGQWVRAGCDIVGCYSRG